MLIWHDNELGKCWKNTRGAWKRLRFALVSQFFPQTIHVCLLYFLPRHSLVSFPSDIIRQYMFENVVFVNAFMKQWNALDVSSRSSEHVRWFIPQVNCYQLHSICVFGICSREGIISFWIYEIDYFLSNFRIILRDI